MANTVNAVFCFFCKIFDPTSRSNLAKDRLKDLKHVHEYLKTQNVVVHIFWILSIY